MATISKVQKGQPSKTLSYELKSMTLKKLGPILGELLLVTQKAQEMSEALEHGEAMKLYGVEEGGEALKSHKTLEANEVVKKNT